MRIAELKQTDTRTEEQTILVPAVYDDDGELIAEEHEETITIEVPVMGMAYRDATAEEDAQYLAEQENLSEKEPEPTAPVGIEERITALEQALEASLTALRELGVTGDE